MTDILNYTKSEEIFSAAQQLMPGGVSSPVRAFKSVGGQPIVFDRVKGPFAWDIDGYRYGLFSNLCLIQRRCYGNPTNSNDQYFFRKSGKNQ